MRFRPLCLGLLLSAWLATSLSSCSKEGGYPPELPCHVPLVMDSVSVRVSDDNPLLATVSVTTSKPGRCSVKFYPAGEPERTLVAQSQLGTSHEMLLAMLRPSTDYVAVVNASASPCRAAPDTLTFTTGALPAFMPQHTLVEATTRFVDNMFILANKSSVPNYLMALDDSARTVWYYVPDKAVLTFNITANNTILMAMVGNELREINLAGETVWSYTIPAESKHDQVHHDLFMDEQGRVVSLTQVDTIMDLSAQGGGTADLVGGDGIVAVNRAGVVEWEWDIFHHSDPRTDSAIASSHGDWSHGNTITPTPDGHYIIGFRNFSQAWKLNSTTGEVMWKIGQGGDFDLPTEGVFIRQHHTQMISDNELMMFDNGDGVRPYSRALSLVLDEANRTCAVDLDARLPAELLATKMGGAYLLPFSQVLMNSNDASAIVITHTSGEVLWLAQGGFPSYKVIPFYPFPSPPVE